MTFSLSYVVVIIRGRLASIGNQYEEAARDLGATPLQALRLVLLPLLMPAILASLLIVFALSIDDFVVTQYMSSNSATTTIPMFLYSNARGGTTHSGAERARDDPGRRDAGRGRRSPTSSTRSSGAAAGGRAAMASALRELSGIDAGHEPGGLADGRRGGAALR